jgi:hypothetical protein
MRERERGGRLVLVMREERGLRYPSIYIHFPTQTTQKFKILNSSSDSVKAVTFEWRRTSVEGNALKSSAIPIFDDKG